LREASTEFMSLLETTSRREWHTSERFFDIIIAWAFRKLHFKAR